MRYLLLLCIMLPLQVSAAKNLDVGLLDNQLPYSNFNIWGHPDGAQFELLDALSAHGNILTFSPQPANNMAQLIQMLLSHKIAIALAPPMSIPPTGILISKPLLQQQWALITRNKHIPLLPNHPVSLDQQRILLLRNNPIRSALVSAWPEVEIQEEETLSNALKLLNAGAADGIVSDASLADMLIHNLYPGVLSSSILPDISSSLVLWLAPGEHAALQSVNQSIDKLPPGMATSIINRWLLSSMLDGMRPVVNPDSEIFDTLVVISSILSLFLIAFLLSEIIRRRRAERGLLDALTYWQTLLNSVPAPLLVCNPRGKITHCNQALLKSLQLTEKQVIGTTLEQLMALNPIIPPIRHQERIAAIISNMQPQFSDRTIVIQGQEREIVQWLTSYSDSRMTPQGLLIGWYDISERKRLERELAITSQQATNANREKSDFLARMSHEIRSPMNAILGILELEAQKTEQPGSVLNIAYAASRHLLQIVGDVLDISKIEAGEMQLQPQNCALYPLLTQVIETYSASAAQKGLRLDCDIESVWQHYYLLDSAKLAQILGNLLSNAIKYTDRGFVRLEVTHSPADYGRNSLTFRVEDSGQGIATDMQEKILQPYVQLNPNAPSSTGLGLAICTQFLKLMGSSLQIQSVEGQGSHFSFTLQLEDVPEKTVLPSSSLQDSRNQPLQLLIVDDQIANLLVMKLQLETLGHQVTTCEDCRQAEQLLMRQAFDLVLTDCQMPVISGYQLTRAQREREEGKASYQVIIGCTANAFSDEQRRCLEAGMDAVLIKPLTLQDLRQMLLEQQDVRLDMAEINAMAASQPQVLESVLDELQRSSESDRQRLLECNIAQSEVFGAVLHRQKGSFALAGFQSGVTICLKMEKALQEQDESAFQMLRLQLNAIILRFIALLEQQR